MQEYAHAAQQLEHWRAKTAMRPCPSPRVHALDPEEKIEVASASDGTAAVAAVALSALLRQCNAGALTARTTIKQECVTDVSDGSFPHHAGRGQVYDL